MSDWRSDGRGWVVPTGFPEHLFGALEGGVATGDDADQALEDTAASSTGAPAAGAPAEAMSDTGVSENGASSTGAPLTDAPDGAVSDAGVSPTGVSATGASATGASDLTDSDGGPAPDASPFPDPRAEPALGAERHSLGAPSVAAACEALLLVADQPMPVDAIARTIQRSRDEVRDVLRGLAGEYRRDGRGFDLREVAGGWRFYTSAECADVVSRSVLDGGAARLSQAALETLAIVAYRQPISRGRIAAVRGVNVDGVVRTLIVRGLVAEAGTEPGNNATLLETTPYFLERLGIRDLSDLPPLAEHVPDYADIGGLIDLTEQS